MDCSPPDSTVHVILQARILEWVAISSSRGIFPTQGLNPGVPHWQAGSLLLSRLERPESLTLRALRTDPQPVPILDPIVFFQEPPDTQQAIPPTCSGTLGPSPSPHSPATWAPPFFSPALSSLKNHPSPVSSSSSENLIWKTLSVLLLCYLIMPLFSKKTTRILRTRSI